MKPFDELYTELLVKKGEQIMDDTSHPLLNYFRHLPSRIRSQSICCKTKNYPNSFVSFYLVSEKNYGLTIICVLNFTYRLYCKIFNLAVFDAVCCNVY